MSPHHYGAEAASLAAEEARQRHVVVDVDLRAVLERQHLVGRIKMHIVPKRMFRMPTFIARISTKQNRRNEKCVAAETNHQAVTSKANR